MVDTNSIPTSTNDSSVEINEYYINYIEESSITNELKTSDRRSVSPLEEYSSRLEVSELVEEIFFDKDIQREFECIFHEFDPEVIISYTKLFQRAHLTFSDPILAYQVRQHMNGKEFHHRKLRLSSSFTPLKYLKPPNHERIYMQSPPTTPPIGWVAQREELPEINFDLFLALSKLQANEPLEILPKQDHLPAIVIHPCSDTSENDEEEEDDILDPVVDQFGQKKYRTIEAKRRAHILHDAILVPGEQQIRQCAGDGDRFIS